MRHKGLEPPRITPSDPKSDAAANYANAAIRNRVQRYCFFVIPARKREKKFSLTQNSRFGIVNSVFICTFANGFYKKITDMFYAPDILSSPFLPDEESQHCIRVLRHIAGDIIEIIDGSGNLFSAEIVSPHPKRTEVRIISTLPDPGAHPYHLHMAVAPTKNIDRFEWFIEKAVEIGVDEITPLLCRFSERKTVNTERLNKIIISAAKQSKHARLPILNPLTPFAKLSTKDSGVFIAHCAGGQKSYLFDVLKPHSATTILIGPEGDFSTEEISLAIENNAHPISLGSSRLRTETAAILAVAHVATINNSTL